MAPYLKQPSSFCRNSIKRFSQTRSIRGRKFSSSKHILQNPATMASSSSPFNVDIISYIDDIEKLILSGDPTFKATLRYQNQKPIIRTLLNMKVKDEFDRIVRDQKKEAEYEKMKHFCVDILQPRLSDMEEEVKLKAPDFHNNLRLVLESSALRSKGGQAFYRLASGRTYKGKLEDLVQDLAPDLAEMCLFALTPLQEHEVFIKVIEHISEAENFESKEERIDAAYKCIDYFQTSIKEGALLDTSINSNISKANGIECEKQCIDWLEKYQSEELDSCDVVLSNVMINNLSTQTRSKYQNTNKNRPNLRRNILWTSSSRNRVCSEFDAVVLKSREEEKIASLLQVWEAKFSMSPSSIHDTLTKKIPAIRTLLNDEELSVSFGENNCKLQTDKDIQNLTLGIFGMELLPPVNALGQLRSTAISYALTSDVHVALDAIEKGFIELSIDYILKDLRKLRQKYIKSSDDFNIVVKVASPF